MGRVTIREAKLESGQKAVLWWYQSIQKNLRDDSQPHVNLLWRVINEDGSLGEFVKNKAVLTELGLLFVGHVYSNGIDLGQYGHLEECGFSFQVSDTSKGEDRNFGYKSVYGMKSSFPKWFSEIYPLEGEGSDSSLSIAFDTTEGPYQRLLIPCIEFFVRTFGVSMEVKRVISTYSWSIVNERLFPDTVERATDKSWPVTIPNGLQKSDTCFLAHLNYDLNTRKAVNNLRAQIESSQRYDSSFEHVFLKVRPWFVGDMDIRVQGIRLDDETFLALKIVGISDPRLKKGVKIIRESHRTPSTEHPTNEMDDEPSEKMITTHKVTDDIEIVGDSPPDRESPIVQVDTPGFVKLGEPAPVRDVIYRSNGTGQTIEVKDDEEQKPVSAGDPQGKGKNIDKANVVTPIEIQLEGALREVWKILIKIGGNKSVSGIDCYVGNGKFEEMTEPKLVPFPLFPEDEVVDPKVERWLYLDKAAKKARGAMIARLRTETKDYYVLECQRKTVVKKVPPKEEGAEPSETITEESFKGLAFCLEDPDKIAEGIGEVLKSIRDKAGVMKNAKKSMSILSYDYPHKPNKNYPETPYFGCVKNALEKIGLSLTEEQPDSKSQNVSS